ncbi:HlyD family secretion protein [Formicincola oecophyllae]|uniref:HlyD family secretion protein n=1 Tax=Formicincola oecophyllae TaxID=2558361 RepID=A0A4Y6UBJ2_9PROT|nr:HlyD family secretion protein [Formicincola oecophyllae]
MMEPEKKEKMSPTAKKIAIAILMVLVVLGIGMWMFLHRNEVDTDDAYTTGRKVGIAPHVAGYVSNLLVNDNEFVHKGQLLVTIDGRDYLANLKQSEASVVQAQADLKAYKLGLLVASKNFPGQLEVAQGELGQAKARLFKARTDYGRQHRVMRAATSQADIDTARAELQAAEAAVMEAQGHVMQALPVKANIASADAHISQADANMKAAQAALEHARLNVEWMAVRAPWDGWVSQRAVERGDYVSVGQTMFSIVPRDIWIVANFKETQLKNMRPGQLVDLHVDAYPQLHLRGHVNSLQMGSGEAFSAFPPENATGNFVKIVQRIPVKILIDCGMRKDIPLAIGLSVEPVVDVSTHPSDVNALCKAEGGLNGSGMPFHSVAQDDQDAMLMANGGQAPVGAQPVTTAPVNMPASGRTAKQAARGMQP